MKRLPQPLQYLLAHPELDGRLVALGMLSKAERKALNELWTRNPLLFDYVLKRTLHDPKTGRHFDAAIFQRRPEELAFGR